MSCGIIRSGPTSGLPSILTCWFAFSKWKWWIWHDCQKGQEWNISGGAYGLVGDTGVVELDDDLADVSATCGQPRATGHTSWMLWRANFCLSSCLPVSTGRYRAKAVTCLLLLLVLDVEECLEELFDLHKCKYPYVNMQGYRRTM